MRNDLVVIASVVGDLLLSLRKNDTTAVVERIVVIRPTKSPVACIFVRFFLHGWNYGDITTVVLSVWTEDDKARLEFCFVPSHDWTDFQIIRCW